MKVLSIQQPWASLVVHGFKRYETRSWPTEHRGLLAIHASRRFGRVHRELCSEPAIHACLLAAGIHWHSDLPRGCLVGSVTVAGCLPASEVWDGLDARQRRLGLWRPGWYAWLLEDAVSLPDAVPLVGQLGLFDLP